MAVPCLLLLDDNPDTALVVRLLSRMTGHNVIHRLDIPSALGWLKENQPDLILLDVNLPGSSGLDLLGQLPHPRPPIALFVQSGLEEDLLAGWRAGADFWVPKDLLGKPAEWSDRLTDILHGRPPDVSVACSLMAQGVSGPDCAKQLNIALSQPPCRLLGYDLRRELVRRILSIPMKEIATTDGWVDGSTGLLNSTIIPHNLPEGIVQSIWQELVNQVWRLFGSVAATSMLRSAEHRKPTTPGND